MGNTNDKKNNFYLAGDIPGNEGNHDIKEKKSKKIEDKDNINTLIHAIIPEGRL